MAMPNVTHGQDHVESDMRTYEWDAVISHRVVAAEEKLFSRLGAWIGQNPFRAALSIILVYLALVPGTFLLKGDGKLFYISLDTNFLTTFTLTNSREYLDYERSTESFPDTRMVSLAETPKNGALAISAASLRASLDVESRILETLRITVEGEEYGYEDVCARSSRNSPCRATSGASLIVGQDLHAKGRLQELELMEANASYWSPTKRAEWLVAGIPPQQRAFLPMNLGTGNVDEFPGADASVEALAKWLIKVKVLIAGFSLEEGESSKAFEMEADQLAKSWTGDVRVSVTTTASLGEECVGIGLSALPLLGGTIFAMILYVVLHLGAETRLPGHSQLLLVLLGCSIPLFSSLGALGFLGYVGLKMNILACMAPFLGIAVGVDAFFMMVTSVNSTGPVETDHSRVMALAVSRGGVAATTTTVTSIAAFIASAIASTNFPGFFSFSIALVLVLFLNWLGMLVLLPAAMVLNERRILANRRDLLPCLRRRSASAEAAAHHSCLARLDLGRRGRKGIAMLAPLLERNAACQIVGAAMWIGFVVASAVLFPQLGQGMPDRYFIVDESPMQVYLNDIEMAFGPVVPMELALLLEKPDLGTNNYRHALLNFTRKLSDREDALAPADCWPAYVAESLAPSAGSEDAKSATEAFFSIAGMQQIYDWDVLRGSNGTLQAVRCRFLVWQPMDAAERSRHADSLVTVAEQAGLPVIAYHSSFAIHVARYNSIKWMVLESAGYAGIAVLLSLLILLPVRHALLAVGNVMAVVLVLFGYMVIRGISCNAISYSTVVMAIGFCVDYSCHVVHFADHNIDRRMPWNLRMGQSLRECGFDVMQGCATAFLGVFLLGFHGAEAFRIFGSLALFITGVGGLFALWCLPALLALLSRCKQTCSSGQENLEQHVQDKGVACPPAEPAALKVLPDGVLPSEPRAASHEDAGLPFSPERDDDTWSV
eukprot:TRINITY_DN63773_c0_g1_i1.p1 TRINITY_DN63773_c0_g1~~TRINITY_DN63773_c0_g1_i1.p1  ORF type:complete len:944 (+),score=146.59 TRINITY_DN63773_c0_g1_i1:40-2871(+)